MGTTKRGKGTKLMAVADGSGLPVSVHTASASPQEITLVEETLAAGFARNEPERLVWDRAYDSNPLDAALAERGIEMIAPHRRNRRRLKLERLFAWLSNFRRLVVRYERRAENYLGSVHLGCVVTLLRHL